MTLSAQRILKSALHFVFNFNIKERLKFREVKCLVWSHTALQMVESGLVSRVWTPGLLWEKKRRVENKKTEKDKKP